MKKRGTFDPMDRFSSRRPNLDEREGWMGSSRGWDREEEEREDNNHYSNGISAIREGLGRVSSAIAHGEIDLLKSGSSCILA